MGGLIGIFLWALIPGFIAKNKGRSFWGYYFLSLLISPLITMIITLFLSDLSKDASDINELDFSEGDYNTQWADIQHTVPQMVQDRCKEFSGDINRLEHYLNNCAKESLIKRKNIPAIIKQFVSLEQYEQWYKSNAKPLGIEPPQNKDSNASSQGQVALANKLRGMAPDNILQHCDSISHNRILLQTYLMQCENQDKISHQTAAMLLEQYTQQIDHCAASQASRQEVKEKTEQEAKAAGLPIYAYIKTQLHESVRNAIEAEKNNLDSLESYLQTCVNQKLIPEYYSEVIWEEEKGNFALRRLQATGGQRWKPSDILQGLAPDNILRQCSQDIGSYDRQSIYLRQQVDQGNVTRQTADLILNIYKLAREQ